MRGLNIYRVRWSSTYLMYVFDTALPLLALLATIPLLFASKLHLLDDAAVSAAVDIGSMQPCFNTFKSV